MTAWMGRTKSTEPGVPHLPLMNGTILPADGNLNSMRWCARQLTRLGGAWECSDIVVDEDAGLVREPGAPMSLESTTL